MRCDNVVGNRQKECQGSDQEVTSRECAVQKRGLQQKLNCVGWDYCSVFVRVGWVNFSRSGAEGAGQDGEG